MRGRELSSWSVAAAMLLAGTWMLHGATLAAGLGRLPGDLGDTRFNLLVLEHGWRFLHGQGHGSFWSPTWLFWPHANTLAYSHNLVGDWPLYAPFRILGLDPVHAFGAFLVLCTLGNFVATLALGRALGLSVLGSAAAASLFAFGMPRVAQLGHPQLLPQLWTPLCFLCATLGWRKWQAGRRNAACVLCAAGLACAALQLAASIYLGVLLLIAGASAAPGAAARLGRDRLRAFLGRT
ncbi:MAG TPA: hypothetical protein VMB50_16645, partial [Myxococcales bacterium]|nr:hypothetical protein [Myxococcales bacterium]